MWAYGLHFNNQITNVATHPTLLHLVAGCQASHFTWIASAFTIFRQASWPLVKASLSIGTLQDCFPRQCCTKSKEKRNKKKMFNLIYCHSIRHNDLFFLKKLLMRALLPSQQSAWWKVHYICLKYRLHIHQQDHQSLQTPQP